MEQFFLALIGFSGGFIVAGGVVALMVGLGIITRFIGISRTAKHIRGVEDAILLGAAVGTIVNITPSPTAYKNAADSQVSYLLQA